jgi:hypothetical protein
VNEWYPDFKSCVYLLKAGYHQYLVVNKVVVTTVSEYRTTYRDTLRELRAKALNCRYRANKVYGLWSLNTSIRVVK